jgi:hypothetical protein
MHAPALPAGAPVVAAPARAGAKGPARAAHAGRARWRAWRLLARRGWPLVAVAAILGFAAPATLALCLGVPAPEVHDEFSYLLAADTFARGRLTNPPHPCWVHFETFHVIQQPSYASKYPPAQGLFLALGQRVAGAAVAGVWLGTAFMCAAIAWMLRAWLPPRWAALGAGLALAHWGIVGHWSQDYFGGAVAAGGGALLLGAVRRLARRPRPYASLVLGAGLAILANSRPWEGLLFSVPALAVLVLHLVRPRATLRRTLVTLGPAALVLLAAAAWMLRYNHAVTGDALRLPYLEHEAQYAVHPLFLWQQPRPEPEYRHERIRRQHVEWELGRYHAQRSPAGYAAAQGHKLAAMSWRYLGPVLWVPALASLWLLGRRWNRLAVACAGAMVIACMSSTFYASHYVAPMAGAVVHLVVEGLRALRARGRARRIVRAGAAPLLMLLVLAALAPQIVTHARRHRPGQDWGASRRDLERSVAANPGRHLVLVSCQPGWPSTMEWVYNGAAPDEQAVVFAHDLGAERNRELLAYYAGRTVWRLTAGAGGIRLERLAGPARGLPELARSAPRPHTG